MIKCKFRCKLCRRLFPSPIIFADKEAIKQAAVPGKKVKCPYCEKMAPVEREEFIVLDSPR